MLQLMWRFATAAGLALTHLSLHIPCLLAAAPAEATTASSSTSSSSGKADDSKKKEKKQGGGSGPNPLMAAFFKAMANAPHWVTRDFKLQDQDVVIMHIQVRRCGVVCVG